ncbi:hypothetical protein [Streptomyces sp. NPDC049879]|uniref:hypothetical protein n=1 Tax=Streptomyces sp. NPDC049879 TaxID=3365598 RepID=UPI0037BC3B1D
MTTDVTPDQLRDALRNNEAERWERAAVELLVWDETWINRLAVDPTAAGRLYVIDPAGTAERSARIVWKALWTQAAEDGRAASSSLRVLKVAASLAGNTPVQLQELAADTLGVNTKAAVLKAIVDAFGDLSAPKPFDPDEWLGGDSGSEAV